MFPHDVAAAAAQTPLGGRPLSCGRLPDEDGAVRLWLVGALDLATANPARDAIRHAQASGRPLICDLSGVRFVDLSGLRVLLDGTAHATLTGSRLIIANCPRSVHRMLDVLGLDDALDILPEPANR